MLAPMVDRSLRRAAAPPPAPSLPQPDGAPLRVLHLITGLERGGAETMLTRLALAGAAQGRAAIIVSLTDTGRLGAELRAAGIDVHTLGLRRGRAAPSALLRLLALIRRERPQLVLSWLYHADLLALVATRFLPGLPLVWNIRCSDMEFAHYAPGTRWVRRVLALSSRLPAIIIANSEAGRRHHARLGYRPRRWEVVPNGFDTTLFRPDRAARARWRDRLGVAETMPLVGLVARLDPMKDHANFLAAAARVAAAREDVRFVLVGRGTESLAPPPALAGRLQALGEQDRMHEILAALDLAVLSSAFGEGFPNVLGEAMACGVPCVATDVGDARAILGATGAIVPPRDPDALAAAILDFLAGDAEARRRAGEAARARVIAQFSLDAVARRYDDILRGLIAPG